MKIEELRRLEKAATPVPWVYYSTGFVDGPLGSGHICQTWNKDFLNAEANGDLIAAARNALPKLLDVARAAKELIEANYQSDLTINLRAHARLSAALDALERD